MDALGLLSTPRTSTSSGLPEAFSASLSASSLAASCFAALAASRLAASCLASLAASCLASLAALRVDRSPVSVAGFLLREAARRSVVLAVFALLAELSDWVLSDSKYAAACAPIPKKRQARTTTAKNRRLRYRARLDRLRFERGRLPVFFKAPVVTPAWQTNAIGRKPTKLTGL